MSTSSIFRQLRWKSSSSQAYLVMHCQLVACQCIFYTFYIRNTFNWIEMKGNNIELTVINSNIAHKKTYISNNNCNKLIELKLILSLACNFGFAFFRVRKNIAFNKKTSWKKKLKHSYPFIRVKHWYPQRLLCMSLAQTILLSDSK